MPLVRPECVLISEMSVKVLSHPGRLKVERLIEGSWTRSCDLEDVRLLSSQMRGGELRSSVLRRRWRVGAKALSLAHASWQLNTWYSPNLRTQEAFLDERPNVFKKVTRTSAVVLTQPFYL